MHLLLIAEDSENELRSEAAPLFRDAPARLVQPGMLETEFELMPGCRLPHLAFARQLLPNARQVRSESIRGWAGLLFDAIAGVLPDDKPWELHVEPCYGSRAVPRIGARAWHSEQMGRGSRMEGQPKSAGSSSNASPTSSAGQQRCRLIREALMELMQKKRRHLLRRLRPEPVPFTRDDSLVQLLLTAPDSGFISVDQAPLPFEQRHLISPFPKGEIPLASDKAAPSRAFAKLVEAELRMGRGIRKDESCVDLGASPGSWTNVAVNRGAKVVAVDRSHLREDLMRSPLVRFQEGDAFRFKPDRPMDWLLCDVIAAPERTAELLLDWLRRGWCRHFVVTIKLKDVGSAEVLTALKRDLPTLTSELFLTKLCANKKEICAFGSNATGACPDPSPEHASVRIPKSGCLV